MNMSIRENIQQVRENIAAAALSAGRRPEDITLVGASKMNDAAACREAIAAGIEEKVLEVLGEKVWRIEGQQNAVWIAMDYVDVVVHIFQTELRGFYRLEELWADAPMTKYEYEE